MNLDKGKAGIIITAFAIAHGVVAFLLAQTVVGDTAILTGLTLIMVWYIGRLSNADPSWEAAMAIAAQAFGAVAGVYIATKLIGWIPGIGNVANAATTFVITQTIGWAAYFYFNPKKGEVEYE